MCAKVITHIINAVYNKFMTNIIMKEELFFSLNKWVGRVFLECFYHKEWEAKYISSETDKLNKHSIDTAIFLI